MLLQCSIALKKYNTLHSKCYEITQSVFVTSICYSKKHDQKRHIILVEQVERLDEKTVICKNDFEPKNVHNVNFKCMKSYISSQ